MDRQAVSALIAVAEHHVRSYAFQVVDNPYVALGALGALRAQDSDDLVSLLAGEMSVAKWRSSANGERLLESIQARLNTREVALGTSGHPGNVGVVSVHGVLYADRFWWLISHLWCATAGRSAEALFPVRLDVKADSVDLESRAVFIDGQRLHPDYRVNPETTSSVLEHYRTGRKRWNDRPEQFAPTTKTEPVAVCRFDLQSFYYSVTGSPSEIVAALGRRSREDSSGDHLERVLTELLDLLHSTYAAHLLALTPRTDMPPDAMPLPVGPPSSRVLSNAIMVMVGQDLIDQSDVDAIATYADDVIAVTKVHPEYGELADAYLARPRVATEEGRLLLRPTTSALGEFRVQPEKTEVGRLRPRIVDGRATKEEEDEEPPGPFDSNSPVGSAGSARRLHPVLRGKRKGQVPPTKLAEQLTRLLADARVGLDPEALELRLAAFLASIDAADFLDLRDSWSTMALLALLASGDAGLDLLFEQFEGITSHLELPDWMPPEASDALLRGLNATLSLAVAQALAAAYGKAERRAWASGLRKSRVRHSDRLRVQRLADRLRSDCAIAPSFVAVPLAEFTSFPERLIGTGTFERFVEWTATRGSAELTDQMAQKVANGFRPLRLHEACLAIHLYAQAVSSGHESDSWVAAVFRLLGSQPLRNRQRLAKLEAEVRLALTVRSRSSRPAPDADRLIRVAIPSVPISPELLKVAMGSDEVASARLAADSRLSATRVVLQANRERADILVLPEWSLRPELLPWVMRRALKKQMFTVAGQTPEIRGARYFNRVWAGIPLEVEGHRECLVPPPRLKRFLSPAEQTELAGGAPPLTAAPAVGAVRTYSWRGLNIGSLICFEFADIATREVLAKSADIVTVSSFNLDWKYFDAIQDSTTRDIYCLSICVNAGQLPGTRVVRPTKSDRAVAASLHGAGSPTVLVREIDMRPITAARDSGSKPVLCLKTAGPDGTPYEPTDDVTLSDYKAVPPRFDAA